MVNSFSFPYYRSAKFLSYFPMILLGLQIFAAVSYIFLSLGLAMSPDWSLTTPDGVVVPIFFMAIGFAAILDIGCRIVTIIMFLVWEFRAFTNLSPLKAHSLEFSPGWAVGWWFIPFANLIKPLQAMKELWRESDPDFDGNLGFLSSSVGTPVIFSVWWAFWILSNIAGRILDKTTPDLGAKIPQFFPMFFIFYSALSIVAAVALIGIIRDITRRQDARFVRLQSFVDASPPPPPTFSQGGQF